ncbi:molybdopterin biosynthesis protein [Desulfoluna spongiiphila]|uniref:Molybdopterin molybdenumtransferase n=1 Tax=Desulfoluna spongiiphila TaxID=419481 RepID=A0A1G5JKG5_9BACT|nr:molybdopterin biosynthesis protein [Desulfoluna spongiiphila]SCY88807.1 molybdopterin molybdochelatase [Desulfoluna spongiiphila]
MDRNVYLDMISLEEAQQRITRHFGSRRLPKAMVPSARAAGRVLAEPVFARASSPGYHAAAMDGIAVLAETTYGASEGRPRTLVVGETAFPVNTGHRLPEGCDAVIMIEAVNPVSDTEVEIESPAYPFQSVRKMGEDIVATELLFPTGHLITPYCVGALITAGMFEVAVYETPKVLIIPTGSELVALTGEGTAQLEPGRIFESNSHMLAAMVERDGGIAETHPIIEDDPAAISACVAKAAEEGVDAILIIGGSSAGSADYARTVVSGLGTLLFHGVTIMPGKPVLAGEVKGVPVFGMPGYPVSAIVAFEQCLSPLLASLAGRSFEPKATLAVTPSRKVASKLGVEEFLRVKLGQVGDRIIATPIAGGAGTLTSITEADGIIRIPPQVEGLAAGPEVSCELLRPASAVGRTLVAVGSHDNTLDLMADEIRRDAGTVRLSSSHVGSMGGLMALKRRTCHLAGIHLLDPSDGSYNRSYVETYLPDRSLTLVNLVTREQGLMVAKGNPRGITGMEDLTRDGVRFVNRQGGSGTRILLDYRLKALGIDDKLIDGYTRDEYTHMSVAVAVLSGTADAGLGIYAAARALDLDFIPVVTEQYDLLIDNDYLDTPMVTALLATIRSQRFKTRVLALGGYSTDTTGEVVARF